MPRDSSAREQSSQAKMPRRPRRSLLVRLILWLVPLLLLLATGAVGALAGLFFIFGRDSSLPRIASIRDYRPKRVTRYVDRKGELIAEWALERRTVVPFEKLPPLLIRAVVAAEDAEFFKHRGLDYMGMLRAFFANLKAGQFVQGGSTITQQVVKTFFLSSERTIRRKMQEVILARRLENELSKENILFLYLNQIYFGHGNYGVQEASHFFFGRPVERLSLAELALLAGLPQSPNRLSPLRHADRAKRRQAYVLGQMAKLGDISPDVMRRVVDEPIRVVRRVQPYLNCAPEFIDLVQKQVQKRVGEDELALAGLRVETTLDAHMQVAAREAVQWGLRALDARHGYRRRMAHLSGRKLQRTLELLGKQQKTFELGKRYQAVVTQVDDAKQELLVDLGGVQDRVLLRDDARYNPQGDSPSRRFASGDLIRVRKTHEAFRFDGGPQAALVAMDPRTGEVLAMVGGYDVAPGEFNRATQSHRQPGSAFKPFVYAAAVASRQFTAASIVLDAPVVIDGWEPRNFDGQHRGPMRLRLALAHSINTISAQIIDRVGVEPVRTLAAEMGIASSLGKELSLALGTSEVTPLELCTAYSAFSNGGLRVEPLYLLGIGSQREKRPALRQVLAPEVAFVMSHMMQSVVAEGTAMRAKRLRRQVAGKTGTTNEHRDAWFSGFTPQLTAVVWVGFDEPRSLGSRETGGAAALPIWTRFMQEALKGQPRLPFKQPPGVVVQRIDPETGLLAPEGVAGLDEYFIQGTEPKDMARPPDQADPGTILMDPGTP